MVELREETMNDYSFHSLSLYFIFASALAAFILAFVRFWAKDIAAIFYPYLKKKISDGLAPKPSKDWRNRIEQLFAGEFEILTTPASSPQLVEDGDYLATPALRERAEIILGENVQKPIKERFINDPNALVVGVLPRDAAHFSIRYRIVDYATVKAMREEGELPALLSGNGLIICSKKKQILLHRRAGKEKIDTFEDKIHIVGGSFIPAKSGRPSSDENGLLDTVIREVFEETNIRLGSPNRCPLIISKELKTGFVQVNYLGWDIPPEQADQVQSRSEGDAEWWPYDKIEERLREEEWVSSGKALVLAWLGLGAPNAGWYAKFGRLTAKQLFDKLVPVCAE
jgi:8-oxo-dGTP pyrophosphatase MutT (NUDIX family)